MRIFLPALSRMSCRSVEYSHGLYAQSVYFVSEKLEVYVNASSTDYLGFIILRVLFLFTYLFALIQ